MALGGAQETQQQHRQVFESRGGDREREARAIETAWASTAFLQMDPAEPPRLEEGGAARAGSSEPPPEEADPRGFHELAFLGHSNASEAEPELEERDVGPEFDSYEDLDGDKLRLLDR